MPRGRITVLVGGQYGSEGKGAIAAHLADRYGAHVRVGSPNAGHTIWWRGERHVMQTIPCGWTNPDAKIVIGRGALVNPRLLMQELEHVEGYYPDFRRRLFIDPMAGVLEERFRQQEGGTGGEMHRRIGSTGEGVGPARAARISRNPGQFHLFGEVAEALGLDGCVHPDTPELIRALQASGTDVLLEGTQGSALSLFHGPWPYCTSTDTNASGIAAEAGVAPGNVTDVLMVCRTYPIRVAGSSGPMRGELTWEELSARAGRELEPERTTVTHKVRRVAEWDDELFRSACTLNAPDALALTFCDYLDPGLAGARTMGDLLASGPLGEFVRAHGLDNVRYFGTGPDTVVEVPEGVHLWL